MLICQRCRFTHGAGIKFEINHGWAAASQGSSHLWLPYSPRLRENRPAISIGLWIRGEKDQNRMDDDYRSETRCPGFMALLTIVPMIEAVTLYPRTPDRISASMIAARTTR